jgi:enterochelin esterase-like enzyme
MKKALALILALVMVLAMIPAAFAADEAAFTPGIIIEKASEQNLNGQYGDAYEAAGYQATFTYVAGADEDIAMIEVYGDFQWFDEATADEFAANGYAGKLRGASAYEYEKGMFNVGFGNPLGGDYDYPEGVRYKSYLNYALTEVSYGIYQVTMPMPAGLFRYQYRITDSEGNERLIADPGNDWTYSIEESNPTPAVWNIIRVGTADEVSESEAYVYPIEDESKQGTIEKATIKTVIDTDQAIQVYLPYDYDANDPVPYKTLYVCHGGTENERTWMTIGGIPNILDNLIEEGALDHTIAVTMDHTLSLGSQLHTALADNFKEALVPYIEANYNVSTDANDRVFFGSSQGGYAAFLIMKNHPELMGTYGLFSFGNPYDLTVELADVVEELKNHTIYMASGKLESFASSATQLKYQNLLDLGLGDVTTNKKFNGAHDWYYWHAAAVDLIKSLNWTDDSPTITEAATYTTNAPVADGDVTAQITTADGTPAFTDEAGVATAADGVVTIDASKITGINFNGTTALYLGNTKIATYVIPELTVDSDLYGYGFSAARTGWAQIRGDYDQHVEIDDSTKATLTLNLDGLDNSLIDSSKAKVYVDEGDGYYPEEYVLLATELENPWTDGSTEYKLSTGDIEKYFLVDGADIGRGWTCLGGDGQGNYYFNFTVDGITYNGLPVGSQSFIVHIYIFGYNYTPDAQSLYGDGVTVEAVKGTSGAAAASEPVWTFVGENDIPVLCDQKADNFYVTWPAGTDASGITADDVTITLNGEYASKTLTSDDFTVFASANETQIALTYINWAFTPVYTTMTINVNGAEKTYDIASVYVYETQHGGAGPVKAYSFYGLANLTETSQLLSDVTYTLSTNVDGAVKYYAEDENGSGILVDNAADAKVFDGNAKGERNVRLIGNNISLENATVLTLDKDVDGTTYTFTKNYKGGDLLLPTNCDENLEAAPGYAIPWGTSNWITNEKWAWQKGVEIGWTGLEIQPRTARHGWTATQGDEVQFTVNEDGLKWRIFNAASEDTYITDDGLLVIAPDETHNVSVNAYSETDPLVQSSVLVTVRAAANTIVAGSATAKCGVGETVTIPVTYNNDAPASSVRLKIDTELPIKSIDSNYEYEFNPASNYVVVYTTEEFNKGDELFTVTFDLDVDPWLADGVYKVKLNIIEATDADVNDIELIGMPGYITIANEYAKGDINRDGSVNNADLIMIARYLVDLVEFDDQQMEIADFNNDGKVNNQDLVLIARYIVSF